MLLNILTGNKNMNNDKKKKETLDLIDIDKSKIFLIREKKDYRITYNMGKCIFKILNVSIPFGIEKYNSKDILNIQIINDNNYHNNIIHDLNLIAGIFEQFSNNKIINYEKKNLPFITLPSNFIMDVKDKDFFSNIKISTFNNTDNKKIFLRTYLKKNLEIIPINNIEHIKKSKCNVEIELSKIWIFENSFGLLWLISKIEIC